MLTNTNRRPVRNRVNFPSLFLIFSFIRGNLNTHHSLTNAVSMSFPSTEIGMSEIHTFVTGTSSPLPPLTMKVFLSYTCTDFCLRVRFSISNLFLAVLVRGYTRHSPRISWAPRIVSVPFTFSAARQISGVSYFRLSLAGRSRRSKKKNRLNCHLGEFTTSSRSLYYNKIRRQNGVSVKRNKRKA